MFNQTRRDADHSSSVIAGTTGIFLFGQICPNSFRRVVVLRRQLALFGLLLKQHFFKRAPIRSGKFALTVSGDW